MKHPIIFILTLFVSSFIFGQVNQSDSAKNVFKKYNNFTPIKLAEIEYNKKAISQLGLGKTSVVSNSRDTNTVVALTYSTNRWWINKYFVAGWFYDMAPNKDGGYALGPQITGLAEFDLFILPYITLASGFGYDVVNTKNKTILKSKIYIPWILKFGGYVFFKKNRGFAIFAEVNIHLNEENWPVYRVGVAWSKLKR